jgi:hypothetical protein
MWSPGNKRRPIIKTVWILEGTLVYGFFKGGVIFPELSNLSFEFWKRLFGIDGGEHGIKTRNKNRAVAQLPGRYHLGEYLIEFWLRSFTGFGRFY